MEDPENSPERLSLIECAALLGKPRTWLWLLHRTEKFADPSGLVGNSPYWYADDLYRWAIAYDSRLIRRVPLQCWPRPSKAARYLGAREYHGAIAQTWFSQAGTVCVFWPLPDRSPISVADALMYQTHADALVQVRVDFDTDGPGLETAEPATSNSWKAFGAQWIDLARALGQPVPYWPHRLRIPELVAQWLPGSETLISPTPPGIDTTPLLRMAATLSRDSPAHQVLLQLAHIAQQQSTQSALKDLEILAECQDTVELRASTLIAVKPLSMTLIHSQPPDEATQRAGWMEILGRADQLATQCVLAARMWDGGASFPYSSSEHVDPTSEYGAEWASRLEPIGRTAAFELIDYDPGEDTLIDPETDAPVVRRANGTLTAAIPQRLTTTSPLAELILDQPIWIRTANGTLYPAPKGNYCGLNWGYRGSGPASLALLVHRLLKEVTEQGVDQVAGAPEGLRELMRKPWPCGTVFTRRELETARDQLPSG